MNSVVNHLTSEHYPLPPLYELYHLPISIPSSIQLQHLPPHIPLLSEKERAPLIVKEKDTFHQRSWRELIITSIREFKVPYFSLCQVVSMDPKTNQYYVNRYEGEKFARWFRKGCIEHIAEIINSLIRKHFSKAGRQELLQVILERNFPTQGFPEGLHTILKTLFLSSDSEEFLHILFTHKLESEECIVKDLVDPLNKSPIKRISFLRLKIFDIDGENTGLPIEISRTKRNYRDLSSNGWYFEGICCIPLNSINSNINSDFENKLTKIENDLKEAESNIVAITTLLRNLDAFNGERLQEIEGRLYKIERKKFNERDKQDEQDLNDREKILKCQYILGENCFQLAKQKKETIDKIIQEKETEQKALGLKSQKITPLEADPVATNLVNSWLGTTLRWFICYKFNGGDDQTKYSKLLSCIYKNGDAVLKQLPANFFREDWPKFLPLLRKRRELAQLMAQQKQKRWHEVKEHLTKKIQKKIKDTTADLPLQEITEKKIYTWLTEKRVYLKQIYLKLSKKRKHLFNRESLIREQTVVKKLVAQYWQEDPFPHITKQGSMERVRQRKIWQEYVRANVFRFSPSSPIDVLMKEEILEIDRPILDQIVSDTETPQSYHQRLRINSL